MAQYLLLEFDDDAQCAALMQKISTRTTIRVRGLFQKPKSQCKCPPMSDTEQRGQITKGVKFGWWVHRQCGKAHGKYQLPRNLLFSDDTHPRDVDTYLYYSRDEPMREFPVSVRTK